MSSKNGVKRIPDHMHTLSPHLVIKNAPQAIDFYKKAFGAVEQHTSTMPDGRLLHASLKIGDSVLFLAEEFPEWGSKGPLTLGGTPVTLHLCVEDADAAFQQAVTAGATVKMPPMDMFWGDRYARIIDPFGHEWAISHRIEDLTPAQMNDRAQQFCAKMGK